jgi:hypothetical protein
MFRIVTEFALFVVLGRRGEFDDEDDDEDDDEHGEARG